MPTLDNPFSDPKLWVAALALLVSMCSAFFSWRAGRNAARALAISESQEKRRQPQLGIYLVNGYRRLVPKRQLFGFLVSISNPTDINNSVSRAELQITYVTENDLAVVCRVQHNSALGEKVASESASAASILSLPLRIDAHQTASGWFLFALDNDAIRKAAPISLRRLMWIRLRQNNPAPGLRADCCSGSHVRRAPRVS